MKYGLLGSGFILYAIVFAELFLRLFAPQAIMPRHVTGSDIGIRVNPPNAAYTHVTPETQATIRINEQGMRADRSFTRKKPEGTYRIALFGDSYFMGYEASLEESIAGQLEAQLAARGCRAEVLNFAVSGFGTAESLRMLEERGLAYDPDVVVFQWHHTDPADNLRANLYALRDGEVVDTGATYLPAVETREKLYALPLYQTVAENSHLYAAAREKVAITIKDLLAAWRRDDAMPSLTQPPLHQPLDAALLAEAERLATANGAAFRVVDIPSRMSRTQFNTSFRLLPPDTVERPQFVSPIGLFEAHADPAVKLYWEKGHNHLTPLGNRLVARRIIETLPDRLSANCP